MEENVWQKKQSLGLQTNLLEPLIEVLKETLMNEKNKLEQKLVTLKKMGLIELDEEKLNELRKMKI